MNALAVRDEHDLVRVGPKDPALYGDLALASLTAYSLYWLHQWRLRRTIEAVAVLNWKLFPKKFAMVGFPKYPDAFRTNRSLLQGQPKYRNFLTGAAGTGFSLNERGIQVAKQLISVLGPPTTDDGQELGNRAKPDARPRVSSRARSIEPERELQKLRASKLFEKWRAGVMAGRDLIHVHSLLGIFDHTPTSLRTTAMRNLEKSAAEAHDEEALRFLRDVRRSFPQALTGRDH